MSKITPKQQEWLTKSNKCHPVICKCCPRPVKWYASQGRFGTYCSVGCRDKDKDYQLIKRKETNMKKLGVEFPLQSSKIQEQIKQTNLERYGVEWNIASASSKLKSTTTNIEKYGCHPNNTESKVLKSKNTMFIKYGVDYYTQAPDFTKKSEQTKLSKYGEEHFTNRQQAYYTNSEKYGVEHPAHNKQVQDKMRATTLKRYGVEHFQHKHMVEILHLIKDYDWLFDQYITQDKTATKIANELGHLNANQLCNYLRKHEIKLRKYSWTSCRCLDWLTHISNEENIIIIPEYQFNPDNKKQKADGFCAETNTIYEFHGDYWHGNPNIYPVEFINKVNGKTMGELYQNTIIRENKIKALGYNLIVMWESDFT